LARKIPVLCLLFSLFYISGVFAGGTVNLPQTGQTKCYDTAGTEITCAGTGQDGEIRAGVPWPNPRFTPGIGLEADCMIDNLTGLMWPKNGNLSNSTKNWNNAIDYVGTMNSGGGLCGHSDWRLPNVNELESLFNGSSNTATWLNSQGFMYVNMNFYWSSTTSAYDTDKAWSVDMRYGDWYGFSKTVSFCVWPVRAEQAGSAVISLQKTGQTTTYRAGDDGDGQRGVAWPNPRFSVSGDCVTDNLTGLMWAKNAGPPTCPNVPPTWQQALDSANSLTLCGYSDWRVPNRKELASLVDLSQYNPTLPPGHPFDNAQAGNYWSSTTDVEGKSWASYLMTWYGYVAKGSKWTEAYVWPVRAGQVGNSGSSPTIAMAPMSGAPGTTFTEWGTGFTPNGTATLHFKKPDGTEYPTQNEQLDAQGHFEIYYFAPLNKPPGTYAWWAVDNTTTAKSNEVSYTISGGPTVSSSIRGQVVDGTGSRVAGATVCLNSDNQCVIADAQGSFNFPSVMSGDYTIWATSQNGDGQKQTVRVLPKTIYIVLELIVPGSPCNPGKTPILLVPGIMGSSTENGRIPTMPRNQPVWNDSAWNKKTGGLYDWQKQFGWDNLITSLEKLDYQRGCNLFSVPYDWRMSLNTGDSPNAVESYLLPRINEAKAKSGMPKVNIIAHSMGGLLARSYIQSNLYNARNDVDKFAMVGTPNRGATAAYFVWEGGDPEYADSVKGFMPVYSAVLGRLYATQYGFNISSPPEALEYDCLRDRQIYDLVHRYVPSLRQLMPTYSFLDPGGTLRCEQNDWLDSLNSASSRDVMGTENNTDNKVRTKVFAGTGQVTPSSVSVNLILGCSSKLYKDGAPLSVGKDQGDGTVLTDSAKLNWVSYAERSGEHAYLVDKYKDDLVSFATGGGQGLASLRRAPLASQESSSTLTLSVFGGAIPYMVDPLGRGTGLNPVGGDIEDAIPGSSVSISSEMAYITVPSPEHGTYTVALKDSYSRQYYVSLAYNDETTTAEKEAWGFNDGKTISFTADLGSTSDDRITIHHPPAPPSEGKATPVESQGLKTRLTWNASPYQNVAYNIYFKAIAEQEFVYLATTANTSYDTTHDWSTDLTEQTRVYAVSSETNDNAESFFSNQVLAAYSTAELGLLEGWNFISLPVNPRDASLPSILADASQNVKIVWGFDNQRQTWLRFRPDVPDPTLANLENGKGYWVYMDNPAYLRVTGTGASPNIHLFEGWNLIGYHGPNGTAVDKALSGTAGKWSTIWGWDNGQWSLKSSTSNDLPFSPLTNLRQGKAYWIKIKQGQAADWTQ
jgi:pimeloyl-ACP methyl ester carboxylesterase